MYASEVTHGLLIQLLRVEGQQLDGQQCVYGAQNTFRGLSRYSNAAILELEVEPVPDNCFLGTVCVVKVFG